MIGLAQQLCAVLDAVPVRARADARGDAGEAAAAQRHRRARHLEHTLERRTEVAVHQQQDELVAAEAGQRLARAQDVLHALCEDLLGCTRLTWGDACSVDPLTLQHLLAEVHDPALRERVLTLSLAAAEADEQVTDGEALVLAAAVERWGLQHRMFERTPLPAAA